jgi:hypothetical protein
MISENTQAPHLPQNAVNHSVLTLEHLAPYLPYGLKMIFEGKKGRIVEVTGLRVAGINEKTSKLIYFSSISETLSIRYFKPILRPLSDFYDINAPAFIDTNFDISTQLVLVDLCSKKQHYSGVRYSDMQEFLREHIDFFNLIEQDLAVSIHDVV